MPVRIFDDADSLATAAATQIVELIADKPDAVIGVATGSSPLPLYHAWRELTAERSLDQSSVSCYALDEYVGLAADHPQSYHYFIEHNVVEPIGLVSERVHVPAASDASADADAAAYDAAIAAAGGVDLQILGIGRNGHIGFNEPGSPVDSRTRILDLAPETIADNSRFFGDGEKVPEKAITQGVGTILEARSIVLIATGSAKAAAVAAAIEGPETADVPASFLRRNPNVTWYLDRAAAGELSPAVTVAAAR